MSSRLQLDKGPGRFRHYKPMAEINVTPFVDVMLVLLVVFMITAPLLTVGVQVDLPEADAEPLPGTDEPLVVTIDATGTLYLQESETSLDQLVPTLMAVTGENPDVRIFLRGDKTIEYGVVMHVMGTVNAAGFTRVALVTETEAQAEAAAAAAAAAEAAASEAVDEGDAEAPEGG